ncbi:MAG: AAA-like domain-containing protein [Thiobacillus sp.]|nr:AAA-like domain-containing protein [Thiobacillus sp.]
MQKPKILRSYTIIPNELYVERTADSQLLKTVEDMGRPGYVLVARQMGKTNLLLNAKRKLDDACNGFIYVDVSNTFPDIRDFFRNIIDAFFSSHSGADPGVEASIRTARAGASLVPPHKEHENELRAVLRSIPGKLIVCLDEIDALTRTGYADHVFSFIRSIYFSGRVNFPEFSRLTFALSGVAEPSELIKDKSVSPFNIGQKIYLDDFSRDEFESFVQKAQLGIASNLVDRIYHWTSGNPRICWDICSAIEDELATGEAMSERAIDSIIAKVYLTNFDLPPIDHIRTIAEEDRAIRDAIMAIHYDKSETISDALRNRLYLAGITKPEQAGTRKVAIRNRVLLESLSEDWIRDVERKTIPILELANKKYESGYYSEALSLYVEYLASTNVQNDEPYIYYKLGNCQFKVEQFQDAIKSFQKCSFRKDEFPSLYYGIFHRIGVSYLLSGEPEKSAEYFNVILAQNPDSDSLYHYYETHVNISSVLFSDIEKNRDEIVRLNETLTNSEERLRKAAVDSEDADNLLMVAHYNLARVARKASNLTAARDSLNRALQYSNDRSKAFLLLEASDIAETKPERIELLRESVRLVIDKQLVVGPRRKEYPLDYTVDVSARQITRLEESGLTEESDALIQHLSDTNARHDSEVAGILHHAAYVALSKGNTKEAMNLVNRYLALPVTEDSGEDRRHLLSVVLLVTPYAEAGKLIDAYWREFLDAPDSQLIETDIRIAWGLVYGHLRAGLPAEAQIVVERVRELLEADSKEESPTIPSVGRLVLDVLDVELRLLGEHDDQLRSDVKFLIKRLDAIPNFNLPYFAEDSLAQIKRRAQAIFHTLSRPVTVRRGTRKYGRNETVTVLFDDGTEMKGKYKRFEMRIDNGACKIIAEAE